MCVSVCDLIGLAEKFYDCRYMLVLQLLLHMLMVASELQCGQDIMKIINVDLVVLVSYISWNWSE